jgi:hypothetical protein
MAGEFNRKAKSLNVRVGSLENQQSTASVVVDNIGNFDFADYISRFSGDAKILRAEYIAERCPPLAVSERSATLQLTLAQAAAFAAMVDEYKKSMNTVGYKQSLARLASSVGIDATPDNVWLSKIDKEAHYLYEKLDRELTAAKSSVNKNAIRVDTCRVRMYVLTSEYAFRPGMSLQHGRLLCRAWRVHKCSQVLHESTRFLQGARARLRVGESARRQMSV